MITKMVKRNQIIKLLLQAGFKPQLKGFKYIIEAVEYADQKPKFEFKVSELYSDMAKPHNTPASNIERLIRHSIANARVKRYSVMTNKELITTLLLCLHGGNYERN